MLAGVADCRRSRKWGCKGSWALGKKPRPGSHKKRPCGSEVKKRPRGFKVVGRTTRFWGRRRRPRGSKVNRENDHAVLKESKEVLECFFLPRGLGSRRDFAAIEKGEKGLLLVGREKVPHGFGLTGDCSSHTADGAGSLNHGLLLPFLRHGTQDWAQGEGRTVHL